MESINMPHVQVVAGFELEQKILSAVCSAVTDFVWSTTARNQGVRGCWNDCSVKRISFEKSTDDNRFLVRVEVRPGPQTSWAPDLPKEYLFQCGVDYRFHKLAILDYSVV